jgi:ribonuclease Z
MHQWPKLKVFSVSGVSIWSYAKQYDLLVNCGDGASALLETEGGRIGTIAITHAEQDHFGGLLQFLSMSTKKSDIKILHPAHQGQFQTLREFLNRLYPDVADKVEWIPVKPGQSHSIGIDVVLEVFRTDPINAKDSIHSVGYRVVRNKKKLRPEYFDRRDKVDQLIQNLGDETILKSNSNRELAFCGGGLPLNIEDVSGVNCLILECTFPEPPFGQRKQDLYYLHKGCEFAHRALPERAILSHFSRRYSSKYLLQEVAKLDWPCPVEVVLSGQVLQLP